MIYDIEVPSEITAPSDIELVHDNPKAAGQCLQELQILFPHCKFRILRNGAPIRSNELDADLESFEITQVREESCQLPSTYRRGWSNTTDEITKGPDGNPAKVWDPENPEDRFDLPRGSKS